VTRNGRPRRKGEGRSSPALYEAAPETRGGEEEGKGGKLDFLLLCAIRIGRIGTKRESPSQ